MRRRKHKARHLLTGYLERISSRLFEEFPSQLTRLIGKQHGVYALYKGDHLYYVGLASNLKNRVKHHLKDKHGGKWDRFSLYLVRKADHIKELESLVLKIADPKGNTQGGRLRHAENLTRALEADIYHAEETKIADILGSKPVARVSNRRKAKRTGKGQPTLAPYVAHPMALKAHRKGITYHARLRSDGRIRFQGVLYNAPSSAANAIIKRPVDGWTFWRYRNAKGEWVLLDELRK